MGEEKMKYWITIQGVQSLCGTNVLYFNFQHMKSNWSKYLYYAASFVCKKYLNVHQKLLQIAAT